MKIKHLILFLAAAAMFVPSCKKVQPVEPEVPEVTITTQAIPAISDEGGSFTLSFNSSMDWTVSKDAAWLSVNPDNGKAGESCTVTITAQPNTSYDERSAKVTITCGSDNNTKSEQITVVQKQKGALLLTDNTFSVGSEGQTIEITVKANSNVTAAVADDAKDWIVSLGTKGLVENVYQFEVKPNEAYEERSGKITFSNEAGSEEVTVSQEAATPPTPPVVDGIAIGSAAELITFAQEYNARKYYGQDNFKVTLTADIVFDKSSSEAFNATGGIGNKDGEDTNYFHGQFDGANFIIHGLSATVPLFAYVGSDGSVKNLVINDDCSFTFTHPNNAEADLGSVVGYHKGVLDNVISRANVNLAAPADSVHHTTILGGLVGRATTGQILNCGYFGNLSTPADFVTDEKVIIGGVVGSFSNAGSVSTSGFGGTICNEARVKNTTKDAYLIMGGIVGYNAAGTVSNCETTNNPVIPGSYDGTSGTIVNKTVESFASALGGIVGVNAATVQSCTNKAYLLVTLFKWDNNNADGRYLRTGGIVGQNLSGGSVTGCNNEGEILHRTNPRLQSLGGIVGWTDVETVVTGCTNSAPLGISTAGVGSYSARIPYLGGVIGENYSSNISDVHNTGDLLISRIENNTGSEVRMGGVIGSNFAPIDGGANRSITNSGKVYYNCNISNQASKYCVGGVIGYTEASVQGLANSGYVLFNWNSDANIASLAHVGGVIGHLAGKEEEKTIIDNCVNNATNAENSGEVYLSLKKGSAGHNENFAGGILGYTTANVSITNCSNTGYIHGGNTTKVNGKTCYVGGIVAYIGGASSISLCQNTGKLLNDQFNNTNTVNGSCFEGGIAGFVKGSADARISISNVTNTVTGIGPRRGYGGGIAGYAEYADISDATSDGDYAGGSSYFLGGIAGWAVNSNISGCTYNGSSMQTSQIQGAGGIVAVLDQGSVLDACNSHLASVTIGSNECVQGAVAAKSVAGSTIKNCHYVNGSLSICSDSNFTDGGGNVADL